MDLEKPKQVNLAPKRRFTPRDGYFTDQDVIDEIRVANPRRSYFGWIDTNVLYKLNDLTKEEFALYSFYCLAASLDKSRHGLSDYGMPQIEVALKMSRKAIIKARERLASKHHLIAYRKVAREDGGERTVVQVLRLRKQDYVLIRYEDDEEESVFPRKQRVFPGNQGVFPRKQKVFPEFVGYSRGVSQETAVKKENCPQINVVDESDNKNVLRSNFLAEEILEELGDQQSAAFYRKLASLLPEGQIWEALSETKHADRMGLIRTTKAKYFTDQIMRYSSYKKIQKGGD